MSDLLYIFNSFEQIMMSKISIYGFTFSFFDIFVFSILSTCIAYGIYKIFEIY